MDTAAFLPLAALLGLMLGSFATCAGHRLAHGGSVLIPARSFCPACGHTLNWHDNLPLIGWLLQGGRCRHCGAKIPLRYPLTELACAAFLAGAAQVFGPTGHWFVAAVYGVLFLVLALIDLDTYTLPDMLTLPGAAAALACSALLPPAHTLGIGWQQALWGALAGGGGLWAIAEGYRRLRGFEGMGLGDAKLMLLVGALLGPLAVAVTLVVAAFLALPFAVLAAVQAQRQAEAETQAQAMAPPAEPDSPDPATLPLADSPEEARDFARTPGTDHPAPAAEAVAESGGPGEADADDDEFLHGTGLRTAVPFGPFLCAAAALYLLYGPQAIRWWLGG